MANLEDLATVVTPPKDDDSVATWLTGQANAKRPWLIVHSDDGVIWGLWTEGILRTSHELAPAISPALRGITLQQAFVFGSENEIRLFRGALGNWQARSIKDAAPEDTISETQILWGNQVIRIFDEGFTHLRDRVQRGLDQVLPLVITSADLDRGFLPCLTVHHFVDMNSLTGEARIGLSRLTGLSKRNPREGL